MKRDLFRVKGYLYDKIHILERDNMADADSASDCGKKDVFILKRNLFMVKGDLHDNILDEERPTWQRYLLKRDLLR